jgi:hypothetical protein
MKIDVAAVRKTLKSFDFKTLFYEHLGWDKHQAHLDVPVDGNTVSLTAIAQKRGFVAFVCRSMLDRPTRLKIDHQVTKSVREHFVIYADEPAGQQVWHWVRRETGKPLASRDHRFDVSQSGDPLIQRLERIAVSMHEEEALTLPDVAGRNREAFDVDKVTKKFYERFKTEHAAFLKLIKGFPPPVKAHGKSEPHPDLQWYTSLMLNRLMFVYFIQKKGFLDGDTDYLRSRLAMVQESRGKDKFQSFYRYFLLRLFHDGLGKSPDDRKLDPKMEKLLGKIPYLNGGFFEVHKLETDYPDIEIPDQAFEKLFDFFEYADKANGVRWNWHLDEREARADNEINPDVVGYIFEKYINQKQMGAYYTKEDITEYISKNTIIPYLFDAARKKCAIAFKSDGALWRLLRDDPDRYIYPAVGHGVTCDYDRVNHRDHVRRAAPLPLPAEIEAGVKNVSKREGWNKTAPPEYGLPTETWREVVARRQRCLDIREQLPKGEVHEINDLVTLNLDIWQFARDAIVNAEGPELLRAFWHAIAGRMPEKSNEKIEPGITILDPTCGSGAFLFAALRILETLYSDCLERMGRFLEDIADKPHHPKQFSDFKAVLDGIGEHRGERYFILKSIIINNLFGVDLMEEAVEICKLRLFLKLVAQVEPDNSHPHYGLEPLPDIDFNIRAGNTLVGFASRKELETVGATDFLRMQEVAIVLEEAEDTESLFKRFQQCQTSGRDSSSAFKKQLQDRFGHLRQKSDAFLADLYEMGRSQKPKEYQAWKHSHQPFHWFVEFYGIMHAEGFAVVIGNPPYISKARVRKVYKLHNYDTEDCSDIYANVLERAGSLLKPTGRTGMIVPLSLTFSGDFSSLRKLLFSQYTANWFSSFARIPAALFSAEVRVRNTIHIGAAGNGERQQHSTVLHRWFEAARPHLFGNLRYAPFSPVPYKGLIPKIGLPTLSASFENCFATTKRTVASFFSHTRTNHVLYFKKSAYNWLNFCRRLPPCFDENGRRIAHTKFGNVCFRDRETRDLAFLLLNGKIMLAFWGMIGDDFDVTQWMFADFPVDFDTIPPNARKRLLCFADELDDLMQANTSYKLNAGKKVGNYNLALCRSLTDRIDAIFLEAFRMSAVGEDIELMYAQIVKTDFSSQLEDE